jgi:hypothetical protein
MGVLRTHTYSSRNDPSFNPSHIYIVSPSLHFNNIQHGFIGIGYREYGIEDDLHPVLELLLLEWSSTSHFKKTFRSHA